MQEGKMKGKSREENYVKKVLFILWHFTSTGALDNLDQQKRTQVDVLIIKILLVKEINVLEYQNFSSDQIVKMLTEEMKKQNSH